MSRIAISVLAAALVLIPAAVQATGFKSTYSFVDETTGLLPVAGVVVGSHGNVYGTTSWGGRNCTKEQGRYKGCGTVYQLDKHGTLKTLYAFGGLEGEHPLGELVRDVAGNLYGVTFKGGQNARWCRVSYGCGVAYKIGEDGTFTSLHVFGGGLDGAMPNGGMIADATGNLYGVTLYGGFHKGQMGYGTVYKIASDGTETVLHAFQNEADGRNPSGRLAMDAEGNLYGGSISGVFKLAPDGTFTMLNSSVEPIDITLGPDGALYGATNNGGASSRGVVFKIAADGTETVLHSFAGGSSDGGYPSGGLAIDATGALYGVTSEGGSRFCHLNVGCGTIYRVTPDGTETIVHAFHHHDGEQPVGIPAFDSRGDLHGVTARGGASGFGTIYVKQL